MVINVVDLDQIMNGKSAERFESIDRLCDDMINIKVSENNPMFSKIKQYKDYCKVFQMEHHLKAEHMEKGEWSSYSTRSFGEKATYQTSSNIIGYIVMGLCLAISNIVLYPITVDIVTLIALLFGVDPLTPPLWFAIVGIIIQIGLFILIVYLLILLSIWMDKRHLQQEMLNSLSETLLYAEHLHDK